MAAADGGELVSVYSRDQRRAESSRRRRAHAPRTVSSATFLEDSRVDGIFVGRRTPSSSTSSRRRKPVSASLREGDGRDGRRRRSMLQACRRAASARHGLQPRRRPAWIARRARRRRTLGRIVLARRSRRRRARPRRLAAAHPAHAVVRRAGLIGGTSTMMGTRVGSVDLLRFVLGAEVDEITAVADGQTARPRSSNSPTLPSLRTCSSARWSRAVFFQTRATISACTGTPGSSPDITPCGKRAPAASRSRATPSTRPPTTRKHYCRRLRGRDQ